MLLQDLENVGHIQLYVHDCCRAQSLSDTLNAHGWPATYISGSREQQDRLAAMAQLKTLQCRVLVSTDLVSRTMSLHRRSLYHIQTGLCNI